MQKLLTELSAISNKWQSIAKPGENDATLNPFPLSPQPRLLCDYSIHIHRDAIQKLFDRSATFVYRVRKELLPAIFAQVEIRKCKANDTLEDTDISFSRYFLHI